MAATLSGVSIFVSSGDDGAPSDVYATNGESYCACPGVFSDLTSGYNPSFPATSPYVTAVGATQGPTCDAPETACASPTGGLITTGGGFSDYFAAPSYQKKAISSYFSNNTAVSGYSTTGRGYPDISIIGVDYVIALQGSSQVVFGTSASSPVFAGMISLVNSQRRVKNLPPVGFINPTLYKRNITYNDVGSGNNKCCAGEPGVCCTTGFQAACGWDPVTGWGSIKYNNLYDAFMNISQPAGKCIIVPYVPVDFGSTSDSSINIKIWSTGAVIGVVVGVLAILAGGCYLLFRLLAPYFTPKPTISGPTTAQNPMNKNGVVEVNI